MFSCTCEIVLFMITTQVTERIHDAIPPTRFDPDPPNLPANVVQVMENWFAGQPLPLGLANAVGAVVWLLRVKDFREKEEDLMLSGEYQDTLPEHRMFLAALIARGEAIIFGVAKNGMDAALAGFTLEDLKATLETLHTTFRCEHGPKNSQKTNALIEKLFDGPSS